MKKAMVLLIVLLSVIATSIVMAQDEGSDTDNSCNVGEIWEDICTTTDADQDGDIDQYDIDWYFTCGYYRFHVDNGDIDEAPEWCNLETNTPPPPTPDGTQQPQGQIRLSVISYTDPVPPCRVLLKIENTYPVPVVLNIVVHNDFYGTPFMVPAGAPPFGPYNIPAYGSVNASVTLGGTNQQIGDFTVHRAFALYTATGQLASNVLRNLVCQ
jgi:hypothetical protein